MSKYIVFVALVIVSCTHRDKELSYEKAVVVKTVYTPDTRQMNVGYGMSSGGKMVMVVTPSGEDEKYIIIFHCFDHNATFSIESKSLFGILKEGDTAQIAYFNVRNKKEKVVDYVFANATKITNGPILPHY